MRVAAILPALLVAAASMLAAPAEANNSCSDAVQGKIAWNYEGSTGWSQSNVDDLCRGAQDTTAPATCFQTTMHGIVAARDGSPQWTWQEALNLCKGSRSATASTDCYLARYGGSSGNRGSAIASCGYAAIVARNSSPAPLPGNFNDRTQFQKKPTELSFVQDGVYLANWEVTTRQQGYLPALEFSESNVAIGTKKTIEIPYGAKVFVKASMVGIGTPTIIDTEVKNHGCVILKGNVFSREWDWKKSC